MKKLNLLLITLISAIGTYAQKLPNVQQVSLRAPANVKVDGKNTEWGEMKAYNKTTELNYTIANDDNKLYVVVQTDIRDVYNRISQGGIKFIVQKNGRKSDDGAPFVKFPYFQKWDKLSFNEPRATLTVIGGNVQLTPIPEKKVISKQEADSIMQSHNKILRENLKFIYSEGLPGVENLVPVYNDKGIEATVAFDNKKVYTCEMAIDLKLLGLSAKSGEKFAYHVVVNGEPNKYAVSVPRGATPNEAVNQRSATTDFWGEYTLAK